MKPPRRILVVKMSSIGDVLMATPVARALREAFPQAHLTWAIDRRCADVVEGNPYLDDLLVMQRDSWQLVDLLSYWTQTRRHPAFDWTIDLHGLARSALVTLASRAPVRVGLPTPAREPPRHNRVVSPPAVHRSISPRPGRSASGAAPHAPTVRASTPPPPGAPDGDGPGDPLVALSLTASRMRNAGWWSALPPSPTGSSPGTTAALWCSARRRPPYVQGCRRPWSNRRPTCLRIDLGGAEVLRAVPFS